MKKKLMKFLEVLEDHGEYFFSFGSVEEDYKHVTGVIKAQGFYSGTRYRFYFDNNMDLIEVEERY